MRILILGLPGAGKTTLARKLSRELGIPHLEVDSFDWTAEGFLDRVEIETRKSDWIIEGHFSKIKEIVLPLVDRIIWLDLPLLVSSYRLIKREVSERNGLSKIWQGLRDNLSRRRNFVTASNTFQARGGKVLRVTTLSSNANTLSNDLSRHQEIQSL